MAKRSFSNPNWTPTAVGDTATMTANGACFLNGSSATTNITHTEWYIGGQGGASNPMLFVVARDSTIAATSITLGTNGKDAPLAPQAIAAAQGSGFSATTMPQRAATLHLIQLSMNGFGGIVRWVAPPGGEVFSYGSAVNVGELSLSAFTGGTVGAVATHWIYESV